VVRDLDEAQVLITLRSYYRDHQQTIMEAEARGTPIYMLRANTINQVQQFLVDLFNLPGDFTRRRRVKITPTRPRMPFRRCSMANAGSICRQPPPTSPFAA